MYVQAIGYINGFSLPMGSVLSYTYGLRARIRRREALRVISGIARHASRLHEREHTLSFMLVYVYACNAADNAVDPCCCLHAPTLHKTGTHRAPRNALRLPKWGLRDKKNSWSTWYARKKKLVTILQRQDLGLREAIWYLNGFPIFWCSYLSNGFMIWQQIRFEMFNITYGTKI